MEKSSLKKKTPAKQYFLLSFKKGTPQYNFRDQYQSMPFLMRDVKKILNEDNTDYVVISVNRLEDEST